MEGFTRNLAYETENSRCATIGEFILPNCETMGRMYNWEEAEKACPPDWRLPTKNEMSGLLENLDEPLLEKLKLQPIGYIDSETEEYQDIGVSANVLTYSPHQEYVNYVAQYNFSSEWSGVLALSGKNWFPVRCVLFED